jgi:hypothetical protein
VTTAIKELEDELGVALFEAARRQGFAHTGVGAWDGGSMNGARLHYVLARAHDDGEPAHLDAADGG